MTENNSFIENENKLFTPITINKLTIKNRIFKAPTLECMAAKDGSPIEQLTNFYSRIAKGGSGLIITGLSYVSKNGQAYIAQNGIQSDHLIAKWKNFTDEIHKAGGKIVMQISHGGRQIDERLLVNKKAKAPSSFPNLMHLYKAEKLEEAEIKEIIKDFADAAKRVKKAGFDGVQIHASGGYLLASFLSAVTNRRKDHWGGDKKRRFYLFEEIYKSVRQSVGDDFPVMAKVHLGDFMFLGRPFPNNYQAALRMQEIGVDALEFAIGTFENSTITFAKGDMPIEVVDDHISRFKKLYWKAVSLFYKPFSKVKKPYFLYAGSELKKRGVHIPLLLSGGIRKYSTAENILSSGMAELIGMARPLIRNPGIPNQWMKKDPKESSCVSCNKCTYDMGINANPLKCRYRKL